MLKLVLSFLCLLSVFAKDSYIVSKGTISSISSELLVVNSKSYLLNSSTEYEDALSKTISLSSFKVGDFVEVKGLIEDSVLVAKKVELEISSSTDDSSGSGDDDNVDSPSNNNLSNRKKNLTVIEGIDSTASGKVDYRNKGGKRPNRRLVVNIKVPVGSAVPNLANINLAKNQIISSKFYRNGEVIASCKLKYDRVPRRIKFAEYKLDIELKNNRVRNGKGVCTNGISSSKIIPELVTGDQVIVSELNSGSFLEGTL